MARGRERLGAARQRGLGVLGELGGEVAGVASRERDDSVHAVTVGHGRRQLRDLIELL